MLEYFALIFANLSPCSSFSLTELTVLVRLAPFDAWPSSHLARHLGNKTGLGQALVKYGLLAKVTNYQSSKIRLNINDLVFLNFF